MFNSVLLLVIRTLNLLDLRKSYYLQVEVKQILS
jgi:hypothetical protein